jgi:acetyl-CoA C-acetyltransferase
VDVAIVGVGLHPFGRFGDVTGIEMGAVAIRRALADASVDWRDIESPSRVVTKSTTRTPSSR